MNQGRVLILVVLASALSVPEADASGGRVIRGTGYRVPDATGDV
jgi:hypothetical protein